MKRFPRDHFGSVFCTVSSLKAPWDLKIVVWGRIPFDIGFRILFSANLEALGIRNGFRIENENNTSLESRPEMQNCVSAALARADGGSDPPEKQKSKSQSRPVFGYVGF